jgi:hypothetical protein
MASVKYSVPDEVKNRFNQTFSHQNKSHIISELMKKAIEEYERQKEQRRAQSIDALIGLRSQ